MTLERAILRVDGIDFVVVPLEHFAFDHRDVIYIILDIAPDGRFLLLDAGESPEYGAHPMDTPQRRASWTRNAPHQNLWVGIYTLPSDYNMMQDRLRIIDRLRTHFHAPCGDT